MRKFKMGLITLAASAAVIVPAGSAVATSGSTSNATTASGALIEVKDIDTNAVVWVGDVIDIGDVCVLNGNQIIALLSGVDQTCGNDSHKKAHRK
jgi:hypothetical protein